MRCAKRIFCGVMLLASLSGFALTETVNGITWTYTVENGGASLGSTLRALPTSTSGVIVVPSTLGGYSVRTIGAYAFRGCTLLTSVTVPNSVTSIADSAFNGCSGLTEMTLPFVGLQRGNRRKREALFGYIFGNSSYSGGIKMTQHCTETSNGSSFYIPSSLRRVVVTDETLLGYGAFSGLSGLTNIVIGGSVTSIGASAFKDCSGLRTIRFEGNAPTIESDNLFSGVAKNCGVYVNRGTSGWGVTIPGTWKGLTINHPYYAVMFNANGGTCSPTSVDVEHGKTLGTAGSLPIPTPAAGMNASFLGWFTAANDGVEVSPEIVINADMTLYAHWDYLWVYGFDDEEGGISITGVHEGVSPTGDLTIPEKLDGKHVLAIADRALEGCDGLTSVTILGNETRIGNYAFYGCTGLTNVTIGSASDATNPTTSSFHIQISHLSGIGEHAFHGCSSLASVTINGGCYSYIGDYAFSGCQMLERLTFEGESSEPTTGEAVFDGVSPDCRVYIRHAWSSDWPSSSIGLWDGITVDYIDYVLTFDANGGTGGKSEILDAGDAIVAPTVTRTGCTFKGWSPAIVTTMPSHDVTYTAQWEVNQYTATFDANGGTGGDSVTADYGAAITAPEVTRENYTLVGWAPAFSGTMPATNVTYQAQWKSNWILSTNANNTVTIIGTNFALRGDLAIPAMIEGRAVTGIGAGAFSGCVALTSVVIPDDVTQIGDGAFWGCCGMADSNGLVVVRGMLHYCCGEAERVLIPLGVTSIGMSAFSDCGGLTSVTIPNSVTNIGVSAFKNCSNLTSVHIDDLAAWCKVSFADSFANPLRYAGNLYVTGELVNDLAITDGVLDVAPFAFYGCRGITNLTIPDSVTRIGPNAFYGCSGLTSVTIPNSVTNIGNSAFAGCSGLTEVTLPFVGSCRGNYGCPESLLGYIFGTVEYSGGTSVKQYHASSQYSTYYIPSALRHVVVTDETRVGFGAFSNCSGLTSVTIPTSVIDIGERAFLNCKALTSMTIPEGVTGIGDNAFRTCSGLTNVTIPNSVTNIGATVFYGCSSLTCVIIPDGVTSIGSSTFRNCRALVEVTLSDSVTNIGYAAFGNCSSLTNITISKNVTDIGDEAFINCSSLAAVLFEGNAPTMGSSVFTGVASDCCAYVKRASTGWGVAIPGTWNRIRIDYVHHDVTFDANGGMCATASLSVAEGAAIGEMPVPTRDNAAFVGWFTEADGGNKVGEATVVSEKATLYAHWLFVVEPPVIVSSGGNPFRTDSSEVTITCPTEGVTIYYADDGTTPKMREEYLYTGPFTITETTSIKALAVFSGLKSRYVSVTITKKPLTLNEVLDVGKSVTVTTSAAYPWRPILDSNAKVGDATARSGAIGNRLDTWCLATVEGAGTMTFWCRTSCEHDVDGTFTWDRLMVYTNDVEIVGWRMDGETDWIERTLSFDGGTNTVKWRYYKDKDGAEGEDCAWVDGVTWTPSGLVDVVVDVGGGKSVPVPGAWLEAHENIVRNNGGDAVTALQATAANGRLSNVECYLLGLDPADPTNDFKIVSFPMKADGTPDVANIVFDPPQEKWNVPATYKVKGAATLDGDWKQVEDATAAEKASFRFFKVVVELP